MSGTLNCKLCVKRLRPDVEIPAYNYQDDSGFDLASAEDVKIFPGETAIIPTGLAFQLPPGTELQVRPRSGTSIKTPLIMKNTVGTIDEGYRGEVKIIVYCLEDLEGFKPYHIKKGQRIAQGVVKPVLRPIILEVDELGESDRGENGFGSTGA